MARSVASSVQNLRNDMVYSKSLRLLKVSPFPSRKAPKVSFQNRNVSGCFEFYLETSLETTGNMLYIIGRNPFMFLVSISSIEELKKKEEIEKHEWAYVCICARKGFLGIETHGG